MFIHHSSNNTSIHVAILIQAAMEKKRCRIKDESLLKKRCKKKKGHQKESDQNNDQKKAENFETKMAALTLLEFGSTRNRKAMKKSTPDESKLCFEESKEQED
ncbi:hypothetical protein Tco_1042954 [Tanacetum coccineum]|uniref:Uncharacterized protein n=1 Tax=Tanacetum coccineum TaxID=301880 RepID=A0ABQ5GLP0_9ASTR